MFDEGREEVARRNRLKKFHDQFQQEPPRNDTCAAFRALLAYEISARTYDNPGRFTRLPQSLSMKSFADNYGTTIKEMQKH